MERSYLPVLSHWSWVDFCVHCQDLPQRPAGFNLSKVCVRGGLLHAKAFSAAAAASAFYCSDCSISVDSTHVIIYLPERQSAYMVDSLSEWKTECFREELLLIECAIQIGYSGAKRVIEWHHVQRDGLWRPRRIGEIKVRSINQTLNDCTIVGGLGRSKARNWNP